MADFELPDGVEYRGRPDLMRPVRPTMSAATDGWRFSCPHCAVPQFIMSDVVVSLPTSARPSEGDAVACRNCGNYLIIDHVMSSDKKLRVRLCTDIESDFIVKQAGSVSREVGERNKHEWLQRAEQQLRNSRRR